LYLCIYLLGFLKFSANLCATGDKQIELTDEKPAPGQKDLHKESGKGSVCFSNILLPPQIQTKGYQLKINLIRAENLIQMDWGGSIDCYIVFEYGSTRFVTPIIKNSKDPVWLLTVFVSFYFFFLS
jgi:C2 domain